MGGTDMRAVTLLIGVLFWCLDVLGLVKCLYNLACIGVGVELVGQDHCQDMEECYKIVTCLRWILVLGLVLSNMWVSSLLIMGACRESRTLLHPWMAFTGLYILVSIVMFIIAFIGRHVDTFPFSSVWSFESLDFVSLFCFMCVSLYWIELTNEDASKKGKGEDLEKNEENEGEKELL
eukprot:GFUD01035991.1.p1 GENE.GFUD01035991.1~~GFUD01035991.1.p1  ORF type:complete len:178 (+),score=26.40 GFUD01035991.1:46-579(+)